MGVTDLNIRQKCDHVFEREVLEGLALLTFQSFDLECTC